MTRFSQIWIGSFSSVARLAASVLAVIALSSCSPISTSTNRSDESSPENANYEELAAADTLQVVTTFLPITYFTKAVVGDRATVTQLLPANVDPHDYQAKPRDIQTLAKADVLVQNGLGLETFLSDLIGSAANQDLVVIDSSEGIPTLPTTALDETDGHADEDGHSHDEAEHSHGEDDPHLWLDPKKAIQQVENIRDALIVADPEGEGIYTANAADYIAELRALDTKISQQLAPYAGRAFVTYHDFAEHFANSYDLEVEHLIDMPEGSPTPADVQRVIDTVEASDLQVLLTEPSQQENTFGAIATDLDIYISVFDSMESTSEQNPRPEDYIFRLSENSDNLARAFGEP